MENAFPTKVVVKIAFKKQIKCLLHEEEGNLSLQSSFLIIIDKYFCFSRFLAFDKIYFLSNFHLTELYYNIFVDT